jgi:hypothetical protein
MLILAAANLEDGAGSHLQRGEHGRGPRADIVRRHPFDIPQPQREDGLRAISACTYEFSSTHNTSALSGLRERSTMSDLVQKEGISGKLARARPMEGSPNACHTRWIVDLRSPVASSLVRPTPLRTEPWLRAHCLRPQPPSGLHKDPS